MENEHQPDWDPSSEQTRENQEAVYDRMRAQCPVAYSSQLGWSLFRHADVLRVLNDHETFSNAVSRHLTVPSGMDQPEHSEYRKIIDRYFTLDRMAAFEPTCRQIALGLVADLSKRGEVEFMDEVALPFASAVQCAFLGWPIALQETLVSWIRRNQAATLAQDRPALAALAAQFESIIEDLLEVRSAIAQANDITTELMHEKVYGRLLNKDELASILRNWTAGEIGTISAAVGILARFLADNMDVQGRLRSDRSLVDYAIYEILRIHGPLPTNRRVTTKPVEIGGKKIGRGERISINWISANRDEAAFESPHEFRFGRDQSKNLLYGAGIHVCPGAPLAHLEMRVFVEELLAATTSIIALPTCATFAQYPAAGFSSLPMRFS